MSTKVIARACVMVIAVALGIALFAVPAYAAGPWDLATDFAARGDSSGPWAKDADGNTVWYFKDGSSPTNPATFSASNLVWTTTYSWMPPATPGLKGWVRTPGGLPHVSVNTGADAVSTTSPPFTWKAGKVLTHPMAATDPWPYAVIEWKSPVAGMADISTVLTDVDIGGTTGSEYWILHNSDVLVNQPIAEGEPSYAEGAVDVAIGDSIYVVVGPGGPGSTDYYWDSTQVDLEISVEEPPPPAVSTPASAPWSLALLALIGLAAVPVIRRTRATA
jgi:hypothetical protein